MQTYEIIDYFLGIGHNKQIIVSLYTITAIFVKRPISAKQHQHNLTRLSVNASLVRMAEMFFLSSRTFDGAGAPLCDTNNHSVELEMDS